MWEYALLVSIFVIELIYSGLRWSGSYPSLRAKGQTRARWFAQLVFAHVAFQLPFTLGLSGFFLWARGIHLLWPSTLTRNCVWLAGLVFLGAAAFSPGTSELVVFMAISVLMASGIVGLCLCHRHSHEFDHLAWGHSAFLFVLLPLCFASELLAMPDLFTYGVSIGLFVLYLRMRVPCKIGEDSIDYSNIFEALENERATRMYLAKIDPGIRDIFDAVTRDLTLVNQGHLVTPMNSAAYEDSLRHLNIHYQEHDLYATRIELIFYIHKHFDNRKMLRHASLFLFPCCRKSGYESVASRSEVELDSDTDSILDMSTGSFSDLSNDTENDEIVYASLGDFEDQDHSPTS